MNKRPYLLSLALLCCMVQLHVSAQWGVHGTFLQYETLAPKGTLNLMGGLDHDVSDRSGFAFDVNLGLGFLDVFTGDYTTRNVNYQGYSVVYNLTRFNAGLTYRSMYFFSDRSSWAKFYTGPFVGFRYIRSSVDPYAYSNSNSNSFNPVWERSESWNNVVFPIGMRIGFRGSLDGYCGDLFFGVGYQAGNNTTKNAPYLPKREQLSPLFIQVGYSYGVGWGG